MKRLTTKIDDTYTCSYCENQEAVEKLGMFEDFMEEEGFENLEQLKDFMQDTKNMMLGVLKVANRWQKLKQAINDFKQQDDTTDDDTAGLWFVIEKMQELEKDDE